MLRVTLATFGAMFSCVAAVFGQTVVDPGGGGHYRDLQAAIDAVPAGTVIKVIGGTYSSLRIAKSLTILGAPAPTIASPVSGTGVQPPGIRLAGSGSDALILDNIRVSGTASGGSWNMPGAGIEGSGFKSLRIHRSLVAGHVMFNLTGDARGAPALSLAGAPQVVLSSSTCNASPSSWDGSNTNAFGYDGPAGIDAAGATVILLDSTVTGGNGRESFWNFGPPTNNPCPCPGTGHGGAGIVANQIFESASSVLGGKGGAVFYYYGIPPRYPWGAQPDGPPYVVPMRVHIPARFAATPAALGANWDFFITFGLNWTLLLGAPAPAPLSAAGSWLFIDPAAIYFAMFVPSSVLKVTIPIPNDVALAGLPLAAQFVNATTLSRPALTVISF